MQDIQVIVAQFFWRAWIPLCVLSILVVVDVDVAFGQSGWDRPGANVRIDSARTPGLGIDSILKLDSIRTATDKESEQRLARSKQLATQREMDLTGDGKPEVLRLSGMLAKKVDQIKLKFTIMSGGKLLFEDSWLAAGWFDTTDHLPDSVKLARLRRLVLVYFANENFQVVDSAGFDDLIQRVSSAELKPHSAEANELFRGPRVMYSVFHSRDYWYGIVWDPKRKKFIKVWQN